MKAIQTGEGVSVAKAIGMLFPKEKRLFEDPYSTKILSPYYKFWIALMQSPWIFNLVIKLREKLTPGLMGWMFCRFRYIDDVIKNCIAKKEIDAIVNLGAGMDFRPYYLPGLDQITYFEIDHPLVINKKIKKVKKVIGDLPHHVKYVPIDFENQVLEEELHKAGYDLHSRTLFIWEGVTQYISSAANDEVMHYMSKAADNSKIVFTYIIKSFINDQHIPDRLKTMHKYMRKKDNPLWIFGLDPETLPAYLDRYSISLIEDIGKEVVMERYMKPYHLQLDIFEIERIALAEVKK